MHNLFAGLDVDDIAGAIGADLIGADLDDLIGASTIFGADDGTGLLEALAVSGLGDSELIGAAVAAAAPANAAAQTAAARARLAAVQKARQAAALKNIASKNAGAVISRGLDKRRRYPLGFVPTTIAAGATTLIPGAPQNLFRAERTVIPSDIAFDLGIVDIKVGNQSQFVQSVEVPGAVFSEVSIYTGVTFDTAEVGNQISIQARNKSLVALEFTAAALGTIAK